VRGGVNSRQNDGRSQTSDQPREQTEVALVVRGLSNREIGSQLYISHDAVKQTLKRIFRKLDVIAQSEMVAEVRG
jgi:DNA-binding CsgD family transcriptional regulator